MHPDVRKDPYNDTISEIRTYFHWPIDQPFSLNVGWRALVSRKFIQVNVKRLEQKQEMFTTPPTQGA